MGSTFNVHSHVHAGFGRMFVNILLASRLVRIFCVKESVTSTCCSCKYCSDGHFKFLKIFEEQETVLDHNACRSRARGEWRETGSRVLLGYFTHTHRFNIFQTIEMMEKV